MRVAKLDLSTARSIGPISTKPGDLLVQLLLPQSLVSYPCKRKQGVTNDSKERGDAP